MNLAFVINQCPGPGGLLTTIKAYVDCALDGGYNVTLITSDLVPDSHDFKANYEGKVRFVSAQQKWRNTAYGRVIYLLAKFRFLLTAFRRPSKFEDVQLAKLSARRNESEFWLGCGRRVMREHKAVLLFKRPTKFLIDAARCAKAEGIKVVHYPDVHVSKRLGTNTSRKFVPDELKGRAYDLWDMVILRSRAQERDFRDSYGYRGETVIIGQWVFCNEDDILAIRRPSDSRAGTVAFGTLCHLYPVKGVDTLIKAFARVAENNPQVKLQIAGEGPQRDELVDLCRLLRVSSSVEFLGWVPAEERAKFLSGLDVFVVSSLSETGPQTGVEAMAAGLPVITTPVGAMPEESPTTWKASLFPPVQLTGWQMRCRNWRSIRSSELGWVRRHNNVT